jgi:hypothetical protein
MAPCAYAAGTAAGASISNTATIDYYAGSVSQTSITSAPAAFVVDDKIDLTVTHVESTPHSRDENLNPIFIVVEYESKWGLLSYVGFVRWNQRNGSITTNGLTGDGLTG